jgi:hypothetical protein
MEREVHVCKHGESVFALCEQETHQPRSSSAVYVYGDDTVKFPSICFPARIWGLFYVL